MYDMKKERKFPQSGNFLFLVKRMARFWVKKKKKKRIKWICICIEGWGLRTHAFPVTPRHPRSVWTTFPFSISSSSHSQSLFIRCSLLLVSRSFFFDFSYFRFFLFKSFRGFVVRLWFSSKPRLDFDRFCMWRVSAYFFRKNFV